MIAVLRYVPTFVDRGVPPERAVVHDLTELEAIPWVAQWKHDPRFRQFSIADGVSLMAEMEPDGDVFWVVAHLNGDIELLNLPAWVETDNARRRREAWNRGEV